MITSRIYRDGALQEEVPFDSADVEACRADPERRIWIDVVEPTDEELSLLQRTLGLHDLSIEDSRRWGQRSKVEFYPNYVFIVVHGIRLDEGGQLVDSELHAFAGERFYLLTIRRAPLFEFRRTLERMNRSSPLASEGIGYQMYLLLDEIADGYLDAVEFLEDRADEVEDEVFAEEEPEGLQERIFRTKRQVVQFRRAVAPMREVVDLLDERGDLVTPALAPYLRDVLDHVIRSLEMIDNIRELLTGALEARMAQASNRLNVVMKKLSGWAAIILIPTLIAGIYGMNFRHMPELNWRFGYPFALGIMTACAFLLYRSFKKRDWL